MSEDDFTTGSGAPAASERRLERALGRQIKQIRRSQDLSVADLAKTAGISVGMLSKIENGQISPSLATIASLAGAVNVPISSLFAASEERGDCSYVAARKGLIIERRGSKSGHVYELLGHALRGDIVMEPYFITLREGAQTFTGFQHAGIEFIYMLSGKVGYRHGDQVYELSPGDSLMFDSRTAHGPDQLIEVPMTYLSIIVYTRESG
ncbi:XRE family transcriptional regulator [Bradyrhizobium sp. B124]|uniref:helix-turn-helix domain-containing protein n=1 Tax=Bradyrhizobium sp. B124 TaxID=3140245 RepID=UPI003183D9AF